MITSDRVKDVVNPVHGHDEVHEVLLALRPQRSYPGHEALHGLTVLNHGLKHTPTEAFLLLFETRCRALLKVRRQLLENPPKVRDGLLVALHPS